MTQVLAWWQSQWKTAFCHYFFFPLPLLFHINSFLSTHYTCIHFKWVTWEHSKLLWPSSVSKEDTLFKNPFCIASKIMLWGNLTIRIMKLLCRYVHVTQGRGGETVRDGLILLISLSICEDSFLLSGNNSYRAKKTCLKGNEEKPKETGRCCFSSRTPGFVAVLLF